MNCHILKNVSNVFVTAMKVTGAQNSIRPRLISFYGERKKSIFKHFFCTRKESQSFGKTRWVKNYNCCYLS